MASSGKIEWQAAKSHKRDVVFPHFAHIVDFNFAGFEFSEIAVHDVACGNVDLFFAD